MHEFQSEEVVRRSKDMADDRAQSRSGRRARQSAGGQFKENHLSSAPETLQIAPVSITVYRFAVATVAARPQIEPGMTALSVPEHGR